MEVALMNCIVIPADERQEYLCKYLNKHNCNAYMQTNMDFNKADVIVCPTPLSKNGMYLNCDFYTSFPLKTFAGLLKPGQIIFGANIPNSFKDECSCKGITVVDLFSYENIIWNNAYFTAEGMLGEIISTTKFALRDCNALVLGCGRCGKILCDLLSKLDVNISFYDKYTYAINYGRECGYEFADIGSNDVSLEKFNIVINTIPGMVFTNSHLKSFSSDCVFYDLASKPGGFDKENIGELRLTLHTCPGIPGKYSPKTAGELLAKNIISILEGTVFNELRFSR